MRRGTVVPSSSYRPRWTRTAMKHRFTASITQDGAWYVAQCLEVDVASQGDSPDDALANLREALELHFAPPVATIVPRLRVVEVEVESGAA